MGDAADSKEIRKTFIVPAIKAFDQYDFSRAKISCSLAWLVAKAFGTDNVPEDLKEPFYTDQYEQVHTKPPVVNLLLSAELYCRAGSLILKSDAAKPLLGHDAVIQALAQKGLYVTDQEKLVTERDLRKKPIQISAHLAMIDSLMMAYTVEMVSVEKVVACVQKYSALTDTDLPYDTEDAVMSWMNKVNEHLKDIIMQEQKMRGLRCSDTTGGPTARYRKEQALTRQMPCIPSLENLLKDSTDGGALAALIHFYCPETVKLEDICLKEAMSLADSLYNLQLIQEFCQENLNGCCHFALEDMVYASSSIKDESIQDGPKIKAEEERQKKEDEKARREYIKQEFLRRKQLKLIEDMDTVIKPRPASSKQKRPRPKSVHRDIMESPRTPVRAAAGSRPRVFSVSSLSLASLNLADSESMLSGKRSPRPESTDGLLSPCRSSSRNEEKDWENGSTTSSVASNTEYTGPKLYKEPSAKSNKHIIQNALAHCCLAGRVNEGQKNKILEEMEKSEANNFLVLLRDAGCQFRSVYTYYPEMEMINKLAGVGPKSISRKMIEGLYKYNSDKKQFSHIPAKTMSASVDAITIYCHLWAKRPVTPKKVLPSK
ncbi:UNVERIFIED_CONTAM: hypothetical protein FKN15_001199 [Acipenser sinensis]